MCGKVFESSPGGAGIATGKTHNLILLLMLALPVEPAWTTLQPRLTALNVYAVAYRYPGSSANKADAKAAITDCREVRRQVRLALGLPV